MTEKLKEVIKREVAKLPKENQTVINAFGWEKISEEIGKKYLLNEIELNNLQVQTLLVLIGLVDPAYYPKNIENEVGTSKKESEKITEEVFQKIFDPINNILIEKIKNSGKSRNANAEQNLNFILSGGNYSAFMAPKNSPLEEYPTSSGEVEKFNASSPQPLSISKNGEGKARGEGISTPSGKPATPQEGNKKTVIQ